MSRKIKWIATILTAVAFLVFGRFLPDDELTERGMAVGIGIDVADDGEYIVTAQMLSSNGNQTMGNGTRVVKAKGQSITEAIAKISEATGKTLTVTHCNVLLLGQSVVESESFEYITYMMLKSTYVNDNAYVLVCQENTYDVFNSKTGFGDNASIYIQSLISRYGNYNTIIYRALSQCAVGYYDKSGITFMPYLKKVPIAPKVPSSDEFDDQSPNNDYLFDMSSVAICKKGKLLGIFDTNATKAINYILNEVDKGSEEFDLGEEKISLYVLRSKTKLEYGKDMKTVKADLKIGANVKSIEKENGGYPLGLSVDSKRIKACEDTLKKQIESFFEKMQALDADVFYLEQGFYSKYGNEIKNFNLKEVVFDLSVTINVEK